LPACTSTSTIKLSSAAQSPPPVNYYINVPSLASPTANVLAALVVISAFVALSRVSFVMLASQLLLPFPCPPTMSRLIAVASRAPPFSLPSRLAANLSRP